MVEEIYNETRQGSEELSSQGPEKKIPLGWPVFKALFLPIVFHIKQI